MADFAVGDIQGCLAPLQRVLEQADFNPATDTLWCVGDLINRGPDSLGTLRFLMSLGPAVKTVLGNHDLHLLAAAHGAKKLKPGDDLHHILNAPDAPALLHWLQQQPLLLEDEALGLLVCHAGIPHIWDLPQARAYAAEVNQVLQSPRAGEFFAAMYGNEPARWQYNLTGLARLRCIVNYFTRMRFIAADGTLDFDAKEDASSAPAGMRPWFEYDLQLADKTLVFGHWAALQGVFDRPRLIGLDTGCVWGGNLTLLNLQSGAQFHCPLEKSHG